MTTVPVRAMIVPMRTETNRESPVSEPAGSILAELGRRRMSVGRLAAATDSTEKTLRRRLDNPSELRLGELERVATALSVTTGEILSKWHTERDSEATS